MQCGREKEENLATEWSVAEWVTSCEAAKCTVQTRTFVVQNTTETVVEERQQELVGCGSGERLLQQQLGQAVHVPGHPPTQHHLHLHHSTVYTTVFHDAQYA